MYRFIDEKGAHLHTLDEKPLLGTSTVIGVMAKNLTWWASGLACKELGWLNPKETDSETRTNAAQAKLAEIVAMGVSEYLALLDKAYSAHSKSLTKSADKGTDMHADLEAYVKLMIADQDGKPRRMNLEASTPVYQFSQWAMDNVRRFLVSEGHCYSRELWVGGITDCMAEMKDGELAIIDFKSSKDAYDSQFIQVAGYDLEQSENGIMDDNGNSILKPQTIGQYIIIPFGAKEFKVEVRYNTEELKQGFKAATVLYKLINHA